MTGCKNIFVDTAPFIYFIEKNEDNPRYFDKVKSFFDECYYDDAEFVTSVITVEEYLVFPYRIHSQGHVDMFEKLLNTLDFSLVVIDEAVAKKAATIRAEYKAFKAMDALQLAAAVLSGCDLFLTNDRQLKQFGEIRCLTVEELR